MSEEAKQEEITVETLEQSTGAKEQVPETAWIDCFLGMILAPRQTLEYLDQKCRQDKAPVVGAALLVILVFALEGLRLTSTSSLDMAFVSVPADITLGVLTWFCIFGAVGLTAAAFGVASKSVISSFVTLAWAITPLLFLGPISCLRTVVGTGIILLSCLPLIWSFILQLLALSISYRMRGWQLLSLVFLVPPLLSTAQFMQALQVFISSLATAM